MRSSHSVKRGRESSPNCGTRGAGSNPVEPENAEAIVSAILYLREHPEEAEALGQRGRSYVACFDREQLTARLEARIAKLLEKKVPVPFLKARTEVGRASEKNESNVVLTP